jgi:hypothetical protein
MPISLAFSSKGWKAFESTAAKQIAAGFFVQGGLEHLNLLINHGLRFWAFKGDIDIVFGSGLLRTRFYSLPELMLEAFRNDRDVWRARIGRIVRTTASEQSNHEKDPHQYEKHFLGVHFFSLIECWF